MLKRQDPQNIVFLQHKLLLCTLGLLILMTACQPAPTFVPSPTFEPTHTATITNQQSSELPTATPRPIPTDTISPTKTENCLSQGGELRTGSLPSEFLGEELEYYIYLPPCYQIETQNDYPVVYLLHGLSYTNDHWLRLGLVNMMDSLIEHSEIPPTIIVLPWEKNFNNSHFSNYDDALVGELLPWIDQNYRTLENPFYRGIGGISRGAAWAVQIAFTQFSLFSRVGAHSLPAFQDDLDIVQTWVSKTSAQNLPFTFVDIGRNDSEVKFAINFANELDFYNIPHEFYLFNGGHTEAYWASHLEFYLRWYTQDW